MLPLLGTITPENQQEAINWIEQLTYEGRDVRDAALLTMQECLGTYDFGTEENDPAGVALVNDSQNAVIAAVDIQNREPPEPTVVPTEEGEGGPTYWIGTPVQLQALGIDPLPFTRWSRDAAGEPIPPLPLPEDIATGLRDAGQERYLCTIDDAQVAKFCTILSKVAWNRSGSARWLRRNTLQNGVKGWQFVWFLHDRYRRINSYRNVPNVQVYSDLAEDVGQMAWLVLDDVLPKDEALKLLPELSAKIEALAVTGTVDPMPGGTWSRFTGRYYYRPVVAVRFCWLRDQAIPMTPEQALAVGAVVSAKRMVMQVVGQMPDGLPIVQETAEDIPGQYTLPDGTPADPGSELWPARFGIREIIQIGKEIVADRECADWDIPVALNQNIPILGTPYGYGEPHRTKGLQRAKNRMIQAVVEYSDYFRFPPCLMSQSMKAALGDVDYVAAGTILTCPDSLYSELKGQANVFMSLPALPPASVQFLPMVSNELDKQTQNAPVLQGYAPGAGMSGKAIESLQYSASSLISYKAKTAGDMCYRVAMLGLHRLMVTMTPEEANLMVGRLPVHVCAALLDRYRRSSYDVQIEVQAGNGAAEQKRREKTDADQKMLRISLQTARENLGIDHWKEVQRIQNEQKQAMATAAAMQPAAGAPAPR